MVRLVNEPTPPQPSPGTMSADAQKLSDFDIMIELMERSLDRSLDDEAYIRWALEVVLDEQRHDSAATRASGRR